MLEFLGAVVSITKSDRTAMELLQAAIGNGGAKNVASQIVQSLGTPTGVLTMNDPLVWPEIVGQLSKESLFLECGLDLGSKDLAQCETGNQESRIGRGDPLLSLGMEPPGGDQQMNVRMIKQSPSPGVKDSQDAQLASHVAGIPGELLQSLGGAAHENGIEIGGVSSSQGAQSRREGEGEQEIVAVEEHFPVFVQPTLCLLTLTLGTMTILAGVIGVARMTAMITLKELAAFGRGPAVEQGLKNLALECSQGVLLLVGLQVKAENVRYFNHSPIRSIN